MNMNTLTIECDFAEGFIRRLLGVIEARGFQVRSMRLDSDEARANITLGLTPRDDTRCVEILSRQISRVNGVRSVMPVTIAPASFFAREAAHVVA